MIRVFGFKNRGGLLLQFRNSKFFSPYVLKTFAFLFFASFSLFGLASQASAATIYINPTCANNGDGTVGSPCATSVGGSGPINTWVGLTWTAGNTYAGEGGTSQTLSNYLISGSGLAGNPITITSYGTGQFTFMATSSYAVAAISRSYLTFDNVNFNSTLTNCLYLTGVASNIIVQNSTFTGCGSGESGISVEGQSSTALLTSFTVQNNNFTNVAGAAIYVDIINSNSGVWNGWTITGNNMAGVGVLNNVGAVYLLMDASTTATMTNLVITNNSLTGVGEGLANPQYAIRLVQGGTPVPYGNRFNGITITGNTCINGEGCIFVQHVGQLAGVVNRIANNTLTNLTANAGIAVFYSTPVVVEQNNITGIQPLAANSYVDGMGLDLEHNVGVIARWNTITGNLGHAGVSDSGQGIYSYSSGDDEIYGNLLTGNKIGLMIDGGGATQNQIYNNTVVNSTSNGIWASPYVTQINAYTNNLVTGSASFGILNGGVSDPMLTTNLFYNNTAGNYSSTTPGPTDILISPQFTSSSDYHLLPTSPAIDSGTNVSLVYDYAGNPIYGAPDIGAYEYQPPYTFTSNKMPTTGSIRLYSDGHYRMTVASSTSVLAAFSVTPVGGTYTASTSAYVDLSILNWTTANKEWIATSTTGQFNTHATSTVYIIGDLTPSTYYTFTLDNAASTTAIVDNGQCTSGVCLSDVSGNLSFTYQGGYSTTHIFDLAKDVTPPAAFSSATPTNLVPNAQPAISWSASSDSGSGLAKYQLYVDGSLVTDNIASTTTSASLPSNLSCNDSHTTYVRALDRNGNGTDSNTQSFTIPCGSIAFFTSPIVTGASLPASPVIATSPTSSRSNLEQTIQSSGLSSGQISSILSLLASFGVDTTTIANVRQILSTGTAAPHPFSFTRNLSLNQTGIDVKTLQQFLNTHGFIVASTGPGSPGNETTLFGARTYAALIKFQKSEGLPATGWFGPMTRGKIFAL